MPPIWGPALQAINAEITAGLSFSVEAFGGVIAQHAPSDTAFAHRDPTAMMVQMRMNAATQTEQAARQDAFDALFQAFEPASIGAYFNYPQRGLPNYGTAYWGPNLAKLIAVKNTYDPNNVFVHDLSIPLKG